MSYIKRKIAEGDGDRIAFPFATLNAYMINYVNSDCRFERGVLVRYRRLNYPHSVQNILKFILIDMLQIGWVVWEYTSTFLILFYVFHNFWVYDCHMCSKTLIEKVKPNQASRKSVLEFISSDGCQDEGFFNIIPLCCTFNFSLNVHQFYF